MKLVVAITGASGSLYAKRLLQLLDLDRQGPHEVHGVLSAHAGEVAHAELAHLVIPPNFAVQHASSMQVPYVCGAARFDAIVILPCSIADLGRLAPRYSD